MTPPVIAPAFSLPNVWYIFRANGIQVKVTLWENGKVHTNYQLTKAEQHYINTEIKTYNYEPH